ncbi:hypothetical protein NA57DRAFT_56964 [Rhizodiscina lignyota]|uniref:Uncharacterized protein n=1 Tax=Rhizodiscina lignyota TaxID=1504668 RepID=A0A9P4M4J3_9PEZI|nr:hypothetical protein NA57DRAFT_56964 [Rhizodiscina lignyota]
MTGGSFPKRFELRYTHESFPDETEELITRRDVESAMLTARKMATNIFNSWMSLNKILQRHEDTIRSRWLKKSKTQRKEMLLKLWPDMHLEHRPDMRALRERSTKREDFMWTYMNIEDLVGGKTFLLLLNSRSRHLPHCFALQDLESSRIGIVKHLITRRGSKQTCPLFEYVMLIEDQVIPGSYGTIVLKATDVHAQRKQNGWAPDKGFFIMELQERLLQFLVKCCQVLLWDQPLDNLIDDSITIPLEPERIAATAPADSEYLSLATIIAEAPYRVPSKPDFQRLKCLATCKREEAEDHIWALREDPQYFEEQVNDERAHWPAFALVIDDESVRAHVKDSEISQSWNRVINRFVSNMYTTHVFWARLEKELHNLAVLHEAQADVAGQDLEPLPDFAMALHRVYCVLEVVKNCTLNNVECGIKCWPGIHKNLYTKTAFAGLKSTMGGVDVKLGFDTEDHLTWLALLLVSGETSFHIGLPIVLDEMDRILRNPLQKSRISSWLADCLAELGTVVECQRQLELFHARIWTNYNFASN